MEEVRQPNLIVLPAGINARELALMGEDSRRRAWSERGRADADCWVASVGTVAVRRAVVGLVWDVSAGAIDVAGRGGRVPTRQDPGTVAQVGRCGVTVVTTGDRGIVHDGGKPNPIVTNESGERTRPGEPVLVPKDDRPVL